MVKILLDPGHGQGSAHNRGYKGRKWKNEGDGNFYYSLLLRKKLESYGIKVDTTRSTIGENPSLASRGKAAKGYDLFMSLHTNAGGGTGVEIYEDVNARVPELSKKLCEVISKTLGITNRGVKHKYNGKSNWYGVLYNNGAKAGMLVEHCFHDKQSDVDSYEEKAEKLAENMAKTIASYYGLIASTSGETDEGEDKVDYSKRALIVYNNSGDLEGIMTLIKWLEGSYIVDLINGSKFNKYDFSGYRDSNWRIAVGGKKAEYTKYINYHIAGKDRKETKQKIEDFRNNDENRKNYKA